MNAPPLLVSPPIHSRRLGKWKIALALIAVVIVLPLLNYAWREARREDTPEQYARLCALLLATLPPETTAPSAKVTAAEQAVWLQDFRQQLDDVSQQCRRLAPIAADVSRELTGLEQLSQRQSQPSLSKLILSGTETAVGYGLKSKDMLESGSKGVFQELKGYAEIWETIKAARARIEMARVRLAQLAPTYSGPIATKPLFECELTEENPSLLSRVLGDGHTTDATQTLRLRNLSGQSLTRCVVTVRLAQRSGESYLHLYYIEAWPAGEWRKITYAPHGLFSESDIDVEQVKANLWSREMTSPEIALSRKGETWPYTK